MSNTINPINYKKYPECIFAMLSAFVEPIQADVLRLVSGQVVFRSTDENGSTYKNGLLHSFDGKPAINTKHRQVWYKDGHIHRDGDLPAVVTSVSLMWFKNGLRHRDVSPALIDSEKSEWWENGCFLFLEENHDYEEEEEVEYDEDEEEFYNDEYYF